MAIVINFLRLLFESNLLNFYDNNLIDWNLSLIWLLNF